MAGHLQKGRSNVEGRLKKPFILSFCISGFNLVKKMKLNFKNLISGKMSSHPAILAMVWAVLSVVNKSCPGCAGTGSEDEAPTPGQAAQGRPTRFPHQQQSRFSPSTTKSQSVPLVCNIRSPCRSAGLQARLTPPDGYWDRVMLWRDGK